MNERPKETNEFVGWDTLHFTDWLQKGLVDIYSQGRKKKFYSFDNLAWLILEKETISEGLAIVYEELVPNENKINFRQAIGEVLRNTNKRKQIPERAKEDLILLVSRIKAGEVLASFVPLLESKYSNPERILHPMISTIILTPSQGKEGITRKLLANPKFDDGYIFEALKILIERKPENSLSILEEFSPRIKKLRAECQAKGGDEVGAYIDGATDLFNKLLPHIPLNQTGKAVRILSI